MSAPRQEPAADLPGVVFHAAVLRGRTAAPATGRLSPQAALLQPRQSWQILRLRCRLGVARRMPHIPHDSVFNKSWRAARVFLN